jgi:hypothetical protein
MIAIEIAKDLIKALGTGVQDLKLEDWDEPEYESLCYDFDITLDMAKEAFPKALVLAKIAVEHPLPFKGW